MLRRFSRFGTLVCVCLAAIAVVSCGPGGAKDARDAAPVLTISGAIGKTNRGPVDPFKDAFLAAHGAEFDRAFQFTRPALAALGMKEVVVKRANWPAAITARGPALRDVLRAVDAKGAFATLVALDGYSARFPVSALQSDDIILAIEADGAPLAIGGRGPTWLVFNTGKVQGDEGTADDGLVWSAYYIKIEDE